MEGANHFILETQPFSFPVMPAATSDAMLMRLDSKIQYYSITYSITVLLTVLQYYSITSLNTSDAMLMRLDSKIQYYLQYYLQCYSITYSITVLFTVLQYCFIKYI